MMWWNTNVLEELAAIIQCEVIGIRISKVLHNTDILHY